jgi:hypothetical protein
VKTPSKPFQLYFESGFPYEKDQWISISATSWAAAELAMTVQNPGKDADAKPQPEKGKRRAPSILSPTEGAAAVAFTQVSSYVLATGGKKTGIMVLPGDAPKPPGNEPATKFVPLEELGKDDKATLAQKVRPLRQGIIVASFPYKAQAEEFRGKLGLKKLTDVLTDVSGETAEGEDKVPLPAFRFLGVELERRPADAGGKPLTGRDGKPRPWEEVKLNETYRPLVFENGKRFEPEPEDLAKVSFPGLVMPRLALMRKGQYPPVEAKLAALAKTLAALKADAAALPEHCLIRVIDVTVRPGQTYRYRLRVRMANPNYKRADVASPELAEGKALLSDWYEVPQLAAMPPEHHVYAVDQSDLDGKKYSGQNAGVPLVRDRQVALQIHKWLEKADVGSVEPVPVGEWTVAERVIAMRGEYVARKQRVEVPYWNSARESFVLASDRSGRGKTKGVLADFSPPTGGEMILVDFEGGDLSYTRARGKNDGKAEGVCVAEKAGYEALILSPDGKLLAHASWTDASDQERVRRLDGWRRRMKEVKEGTAPGDSKGVFGDR